MNKLFGSLLKVLEYACIFLGSYRSECCSSKDHSKVKGEKGGHVGQLASSYLPRYIYVCRVYVDKRPLSCQSMKGV